MTRARTPCLAELRAILARLLVLLALLLVGMPHGHSHRMLAQADLVAHSQVEQARGIVSAQRLLPLVQVFDDHSPDMGKLSGLTVARQPVVAAAMLYSPQPSFPLLAIRIHPPVRGPPVI